MDPTSPATGVNIEQMFGNFHLLITFLENHSIGVAAIVGWQRFAAQGLAAFSGFSNDPANLTGNVMVNSFRFWI